jgi:DNA repair exonuclease SbcCD ATPase subunit
MTYRERREARAERLTEWAGKREERAAAVFKAGEPFRGDIAFSTQPGHIPFRAQLIAREDRAHESLRKAGSMRSRADGIEGQLATSIYDDDPDAVEQLRARIARLEAERDAAKAANAAYRKQHKAELAAMDSAYLRNQAMPYPSYHFQNLSGNISRQRERLARLERTARAVAAAEAAAPIASAAGVTVRPSAVTGLDGYVDVVFDAKPDAEVRQGLKDHGFRWAKAAGCWYGRDAAFAESLAIA